MAKAATAKKVGDQPRLPGYKPTALENASRDLLVAREELEAAQSKVERAGLAMIQVMKEQGRTSLLVEGYTISIDMIAAREKLKVKQAEQR